MKLKKLVALTLASVMVFSMAACSSKEKTKSGTDASDETLSAEDEAILNTVIDEFALFRDGKSSNYSSDCVMAIEMTVTGVALGMEMDWNSSSYEGVSYSKTTTKVIALGQEQKTVVESYSINNDDGTIKTAEKNNEDDGWTVTTSTKKDSDDIDIEAIRKTATMTKDGDNYYVTMDISADDMGISDTELFASTEGLTIQVVVTYNASEKMITEFDANIDLEVLSQMFAELGEVEITGFSMKINNIKKNDKPIEIPEEIELN